MVKIFCFRKTTKIIEHYTNLGCEHTPPNNATTSATDSKFVEQGQGDGIHNNCSPAKKSRIETEDDLPMKYIQADGYLEFTGKSSKKLQPETRWSRPCKLQIAYTQTSFEDCTIYLMIYEGNMKCRRNLMKDFDASTSE